MSWVFPTPVMDTHHGPAIMDLPRIPYRIHTPKLTQFVTGQNFHYFKLRLFDINRYFQTKKSWNHDYPPGQKIYSDTPSSAALRSVISAEHSILYSSRSCRDGNTEGSLGRSPGDFFNLLTQNADSPGAFSGFHSAIKSGFETLTATGGAPAEKEDLHIYTYVLMDETLRFSRCGAGTSVDMSSKHALHAGAAPEVFYAGEFWTEPDITNPFGQKLIIDNNSGTFAPPKCDLYRMKELMQANFPGIVVITLDYQDPEWKIKRRKEEVINSEQVNNLELCPPTAGWLWPNLQCSNQQSGYGFSIK